MTENEERYGWWGVPAAEEWVCPECGERSPTVEWEVCEPYCEDCGSHDGRMCPRCNEVYDHVWDADRLEKAQRGYGIRTADKKDDDG